MTRALRGALIVLAAAIVAVVVQQLGSEPGAGPESGKVADLEPDRAALSSPAALRVRVVADDWATPMPAAEVRVFHHDPRRMELPHDPIAITSDRDGIAVLRELDPGPYLICGPGVEPGADPPATARAEIVAGESGATVVVAAAPQTVPLRVEVFARFTPRFGVSTRLALARVDDGSRREVVFPRVVEPGTQTVELQIAPGDYEVTTRPLGELIVRADEQLVRVRGDGASAVLHVEGNPGRIAVTLRGMPDTELPARVVPFPVDRVPDHRAANVWWGPFRWDAMTMTVPALELRHRINVYGRTQSFVARGAVELDSDAVTIDLVPATRLLIDVTGWNPSRDLGSVVWASTTEESSGCALLPTFGPERPDLHEPALAGEMLLVRGGDCELICMRPDGSEVWKRRVSLDDVEVRVRVTSED